MRKNRTQGFTLIELLIVIAIIAILAAVLIPNVVAARKRANDSAAKSYARQVVTAVESYLSADPRNTIGDILQNTLNGTTAGAGAAGDQSTAECKDIDALNQTGNFEGDLATTYPTSVQSCYIYADGTGGYGVAVRSTTNTWWGLYNGRYVDLGNANAPNATDPNNW